MKIRCTRQAGWSRILYKNCWFDLSNTFFYKNQIFYRWSSMFLKFSPPRGSNVLNLFLSLSRWLFLRKRGGSVFLIMYWKISISTVDFFKSYIFMSFNVSFVTTNFFQTCCSKNFDIPKSLDPLFLKFWHILRLGLFLARS